MAWYTVSLLFRSVHTPPSRHETIWEETHFLISAGTEEEARERAEVIGRANRVSYRAVPGHVVDWVLDAVERVHCIGEGPLADGTELFHRFLRESEVMSIRAPFDDE